MQLSNRHFQAEFCNQRSNLLALRLRRGAGTADWSDRPGSVTIIDDRKRRSYSDVDQSIQASTCKTRTKVTTTKQIKGAEFALKETWHLVGDTLRWDLEITLAPGAKARSIQVRQLLPIPDPAYGINVWTARADFPTTIERLAGLDLQYGEVCYGTLLPSLTLYRRDLGVGLTVTKPFAFRTSRLSFEFMDYREPGISLNTSMLALRPDQPARTSFVFHAHEPCWRSGLAWLYKNNPTYFDPPNPAVREYEGGYTMGHPFMTGSEIDSMLPHQLRWSELHCHFPWYGDYLPDEDEWHAVDNYGACVAVDQVGGAVVDAATGSAVDGKSGSITYDVLHKHLATVKKRDVKSLFYWQAGGDASPCIVKKFPDSLALNEHGESYPSCDDSVLMNADASTAFGRDMRRQISRLYRRLPEIDGIFLDQLCYDAIDYAHDDGITMVDNKPVYRLWHCFEQPVRKLAAATHRRGKVLYANGPYNIEVQKDMDGLMAEGASWIAEVVKYLCISKPLIFLAFYHDDLGKAEAMFQCCLLSGASYSLYPHPPEAIRQMIERYRPLVEKFYGRRWLLEPDPLELPQGIAGNIFVAENGNILVSIVSTGESCLSAQGQTAELEIGVRCQAADQVKTAVCSGPLYRGERKVRMRRQDGELRLRVRRHVAATVIELRLA